MIPESAERAFEIKDSPERRAQFRVSIFGIGSESTARDTVTIENAKTVSENVVEKGFSIATGGYDTGVMKAANDAGVAKAKALGVAIPENRVKAFPLSEDIQVPVGVVQDADIQRAESLSERLQFLIDYSHAFVVLGGRFGSVVELLTTLESERIRQFSREKPADRPVIVIDPSFEHLHTLVSLADKDQKLQNAKPLEHTYFIAGFEGWQEKAARILEGYYQRSLGKKLDMQEEQYLSENNFKYNYEHWLENAQTSGYHL